MPRHNFAPLRGRVATLEIASAAAADNQLGDPGTRQCPVYLPPSYDEGQQRYPLLVALAAYTGSGLKLANWNSFDETLPQRVDRLIADEGMPPCVVAMPDCFTSLGGNQYLNSPVLGRWEDFIYEDLLVTLESRLRLLEGPRHRGLFGHSSGGYGALVHAMRYGERWGGIACHSGDMGFDMVYRPDLPKAVNALAAFDGSHEAFLEALAESPKIRGDQFYAMMILAMAASYDYRPDEPMGIKLPVDLHTCALDPAAWQRWLAHDPLVMIEEPLHQERLRKLRAIFIDCGSRDEYQLHFGARRLHLALNAAKIEHRYEEFPDGHSKVAYRLDRSLPHLVKALS